MLSSLGLVLAFVPAVVAGASAESPALRRRDPLARRRRAVLHAAYERRSRLGGIDGIFLGDSITQGWTGDGRAIFDDRFAPRRAVAYGIGGDRTTDVVDRVRDGELGGARPRVVVLLIGTNDLGVGSGVREVVAGTIACVAAIRDAVPHACVVVVLGILPRGAGGPREPQRLAIVAVNEALARYAASGDGTVRTCDVGASFTAEDGSLDPAAYHDDLLHLSAEGYRRLAFALEPELAPLLGALSTS